MMINSVRCVSRIALSMVLSVFVSACSDSDSTSSTEDDPEVIHISGVVWELKEYGIAGDDAVEVLGGTHYTLEFLDSNTLYVRVRCNATETTYQLDPSIQIGPIDITDDSCSTDDIPGIQDFDQLYLDSISSITSYEIINNQLYFRTANGYVFVYDWLRV